jgi:hypothetical protein
MEKRLCLSFAVRVISILLCFASIALITACESRESKIEKSILDYLKTKGAADVKEVELVLFHTESNSPEKAYASALLVYASGDVSAREGQKNMQEGSGYILKQNGGSWMVEASAKYTDKPEDAAKLLAGEKIRR